MPRTCSRALWAALLLPAALPAADAVIEGTYSVGGGGVLLNGDRPSFQQANQLRKDGFGGLEELRIYREDDETIFRFDARLMTGEDDYRLGLRFEKPDAWYLATGYESFRIYYDGTAGIFRPNGVAFKLYDEDLSLTRSKFWFEAGRYLSNQTLLSFRYQRNMRDGTKDSTSWGDTNLVGAPYGTRNVVPSFYNLDEVTQVFTANLGNTSKPEVKWNVGARYAETELNNQRNMRRRPNENADRVVTSKDETKTDIFAAHGYYQRVVSEKLTVSGGALITDLDSLIAGSRIYGQSYDPAYDPAYLRRQQRDEGFFDLDGHAEMKQTVLNLNAVYLPKKNWSIRPSLRFENLHQETLAHFVETNIGAGPAFAATLEEMESQHDKKWNEFVEAVEVRYTGKPNWTFSAEGQWIQGEGDLQEHLVDHHTAQSRIDRDMDVSRNSQKYSAKANWYPKPGLSFAGQYYYKVNVNDYDAVRDNTAPASGDRYPAYITDQDFETHDFNLRMSWRPAPMLSLVTRYDYQRSRVVSTEAGLSEVESSELTSHIISQSATWSPTGRLYLTANLNVTWDQLSTPSYPIVLHGDNNYVNGSLGAGYALAKKDDLYLDYTYYGADNFIDNSAISMPFGVDEQQQAVYVTWVRRQSEHLIFTFKYGYLTKDDNTWVGLDGKGLNDYDAHLLYGKVQYRF